MRRFERESDEPSVSYEPETTIFPEPADPPRRAKESSLERLVRLARRLEGEPAVRVYAVNRRDGAPRGRSRVEGPGPRIDRVAHGIPPSAVHVLTLDLCELPELAARCDGAQLLSVYARDPAAGVWDGWVVATSAAVDAPDAGGAPASALELTAVEVPRSVFADVREDEDDEVLGLLHAQHGWVLGRPRWLGAPAGPDERFVMQFGGELGRRFVVPENGELYVLVDRVVLQTQ